MAEEPTTPQDDVASPQDDAVSPQDNPVKDPEEWVTGDEPMTGPQKSYLQTLAREAGRDVDFDEMTKADASKLIDELQVVSGRGTGPE